MTLKQFKYGIKDTRTILGVVGLLLLAVLVMSAISSRKAARITGLSVEIMPLSGESFMINQDEIKSIIYEGYRRDVEDLTVESVDIKAVEALLESEPFIANADVFVNADDRLDIKIDQANAAIRIMDEKGRSYYLTEDVTPFPISKHASARVAVFSGSIPLFDGSTDSLSVTQIGVVELMNIIKENKFARKMIEQVHIRPNGEFLIQPKMGRFKFDLGQPTLLIDKIERMELAYKDILPKNGWNTYSKIDLSYDGQIICKK